MTSKLEKGTIDDSWDLLPWYVNGTVSDAEREQIERDLAASSELREELVEQKRLCAAMEKRDYFDAVEDSQWDRLSGLLDREELSVEAPVLDAPGAEEEANVIPFRSSRKRLSTPLRYGGLIAASLLIVGYLVIVPNTANQDFQTLTNDEVIGDNMLRIKAADGVNTSDIMAYLAEQGLDVVEGPSSTGVYTLRVVNREIDVDALVATMSNAPQIAFVTRIGGE